jgi:ethanolamine utilization protein EutA (predicted chaperonin)
MTEEGVEGRIFFSSVGRTLAEEDQISLLSVGVDIGSSTSHLAFSRIVLERLENRYVVTERETFFESEILLTPYTEGELIDAESIGRFLQHQYQDAQIAPNEIDTGALILTGVAVQRRNARRIGELFAEQAGKMVAVSAGDALEATMAAFGSGAAARSIRDAATVMNVDIGGGTTKIAVCAEGKVVDLTALDVGARLVCFDAERRITRLEKAGELYAAELGVNLQSGAILDEAAAKRVAGLMADRLVDAMHGRAPTAAGSPLLRLPPLGQNRPVDEMFLCGGVAEYFYGKQSNAFGDLGPLLASALRKRLDEFDVEISQPRELIRATVIGAAQYTTQVSGSTIYVSPLDVLPMRNVPVIIPDLRLEDKIDPAVVSAAIMSELRKLDLDRGPAVAVFVRWEGSATFQRLDACCRGLADGLKQTLQQGHPLIIVGDNDVGGLMGIHCRHEMKLKNPIVSIDALQLTQFNFIDIGAVLETSGAVPVVIKSLIFPGDLHGHP